MSKKEVTKLRLSLEETQLQKEAVERHLRLEIDSLKGRLQQQQVCVCVCVCVRACACV